MGFILTNIWMIARNLMKHYCLKKKNKYGRFKILKIQIKIMQKEFVKVFK